MTSQHRWVQSVSARLQQDIADLQVAIETRKHIHVKFSRPGGRFLWVVSSTPSHIESARLNAARDLRKGLAQHLGITGISSLRYFPMQLARVPVPTDDELWDEWWEALASL